MSRTVQDITATIRKLNQPAEVGSGEHAARQSGLASAAVDLADALGDPIEASAWIIDDDHAGDVGLWVLSGIDDETGMAVYELLSLDIGCEGAPLARMRALGIEEVYGIKARGPLVLIRTRAAE